MKRLDVVTMSGGGEELIRSLQRLKCVELTSCPVSDDYPGGGSDKRSRGAVSADLTEKISGATAAEEFLAAYSTVKRGMFAKPPEEDAAAFEKHRERDAESLVKEALKLRARMQGARDELIRERERLAALEMWVDYTFPIPVWKTKNTVNTAGMFPPGTKLDRVDEKLGDLPAVISEISVSPTGIAAVLSSTADTYDESLKAVKSFGFAQTAVTAGEDEDFAAGAYKFAAERIRRLEAMEDKLRGAARRMADGISEIRVYCDVLTTRRDAVLAEGMIEKSRMTERLSGWVPEKSVLRVTRLLEKRGDAYSFRDPEEGEEPPVLLDNPTVFASFEPVIGLYSLPAYGSFDPTSVMSIFYVLIFGLMFADVGYGLLVTLVCMLGLKLINPDGSLRKFLRMFAYCGVSCAVMGALFGGYFGDLPVQIMTNIMGVENAESPALWFDMVSNPMLFLVVSLVAGAVHLFAALGVKFYVLAKKGKLLDAVFDAGSWMLLFIGAGVFMLSSTAGVIIVIASLLMLVLTQGRHEKNIVMKLFKGVSSLYDIVGYISDLLSYSRILALGLASAVIASVFNILGTMAGPGIGSVIGLLLVFLIGHPLNLAINLLGTFVHTSRLQYIEFFGKFYEDGGRPFEPLTQSTKYVTFR